MLLSKTTNPSSFTSWNRHYSDCTDSVEPWCCLRRARVLQRVDDWEQRTGLLPDGFYMHTCYCAWRPRDFAEHFNGLHYAWSLWSDPLEKHSCGLHQCIPGYLGWVYRSLFHWKVHLERLDVAVRQEIQDYKCFRLCLSQRWLQNVCLVPAMPIDTGECFQLYCRRDKHSFSSLLCSIRGLYPNIDIQCFYGYDSELT